MHIDITSVVMSDNEDDDDSQPDKTTNEENNEDGRKERSRSTEIRVSCVLLITVSYAYFLYVTIFT